MTKTHRSTKLSKQAHHLSSPPCTLASTCAKAPQLVVLLMTVAVIDSCCGFSGISFVASQRNPFSRREHLFPRTLFGRGFVVKSAKEDEILQGNPEYDDKDSILVIGGGPAGLAVSLGLSTLAGKKVQIIEKRHEFVPAGATIGIAPNGLKALKEIRPDLVSFMVESLGVSLGHGVVLFPWWSVRDALLEEVKKDPNIILRTGWDLQGIDDESNDEFLTAHFLRTRNNATKINSANNEDSESPKLELTGRLLIGADGIRSTVRHKLGLKPTVDIGSSLFRGHIIDGEKDPLILKKVLESGRVLPFGSFVTFRNATLNVLLFNFHDQIPGLIVWVVHSPLPLEDDTFRHGKTPIELVEEYGVDDGMKEDWAVIKAILERSPKEHLRALRGPSVADMSEEYLANFAETFQDCVEIADQSGKKEENASKESGDEKSIQLAGWGGRGRVTIIGDAAHAMRAVDGQGGNMAFEDAVILSRRVRDFCGTSGHGGHHAATPSIFLSRASCHRFVKEFENERFSRVKTMHDNQRIRYEMNKRGQVVFWDDEFRNWVYDGV